jgi:hypothetical protein
MINVRPAKDTLIRTSVIEAGLGKEREIGGKTDFEYHLVVDSPNSDRHI